jgi:hypothetical protein
VHKKDTHDTKKADNVTYSLVTSRKGAKSLGHQRRSSPSRALLAVLLVLVALSGLVIIYFAYPFTTGSPTRVREGGIAIVDALSELDPNPGFEQTAIEYSTAAGMYVDVYNSSTASVQFMKSLPAGYDLVIFRIHSGTGTHGVFYFTSEPYDESKYQPEQFRDELRPAKDYEGHPQVFAFGAKFVDTYMRGRLQNTIIIGMGCFGVGTSYGTDEEPSLGATTEAGSNIADAFIRQGASAVIGWDSLVSLTFSDQATLRLIKALTVEHMSISKAVEATNRELGPDPIYKSRLAYYPENGGDNFLHYQPQSFALPRLFAPATPVKRRGDAGDPQTNGNDPIPSFSAA